MSASTEYSNLNRWYKQMSCLMCTYLKFNYVFKMRNVRMKSFNSMNLQLIGKIEQVKNKIIELPFNSEQ